MKEIPELRIGRIQIRISLKSALRSDHCVNINRAIEYFVLLPCFEDYISKFRNL